MWTLAFTSPIACKGAKGDWDFESPIWSKTLMELIFNPCGEFRWSPEWPVSQIHSPHLPVGASGIFPDLIKPVQFLKREGVRKATGSYRTYSSLVKLQSFGSWVCGGRPAFDRTAALAPALAVKDLPLGRTLWLWWRWWPEMGIPLGLPLPLSTIIAKI